jgi:spore germination protein D
MKLTLKFAIALVLMILLTSCAASQEPQGMDYKETKSMVVDILKTEEAKKAIEEATKEKKEGEDKLMKMLSSPEGQQIQIAVKDVLTDPNYPKHLEKLMKDPKFAGEFAKAVQKENKEIHKQLMKDPEYQTLLTDVMKSPDYEKIIVDVLKGKEYRKQAMSIMEDALKNPLFRLELMELMKKVIEEESKPKEEGGGGGGGGGGGS